MEVSLVAFLYQGNYASGLEALTRTFVVSGAIVGVDILLKVHQILNSLLYFSWKDMLARIRNVVNLS